MKKKLIYLDYAASTPIRKEVLKEIGLFQTKVFGNASSLHEQGRMAKKALENSREIIAKILNSRPEEIVFTSGGTESSNLAIFGLTQNYNKPGHIITTQIEHPSVLEPVKLLESKGWKVSYLPVNKQGLININGISQLVRSDTVLISIIYANNEIGAIQPIPEIGKLVFGLNEKRKKQGLGRIYFHTDACQASGFLYINTTYLGVDMMTLNASKIYGPSQTGLLYVKTGVCIKPIILGGGQERGLRSGTENVAGVRGMAKALELAQKESKSVSKRLLSLSDYCFKQILKVDPKIILNGSEIHSGKRLPNNINICIPGVSGEDLVIYLDAKGVCVSTGSACHSLDRGSSYVLRAIGLTPSMAKSSIRITLGKDTTKKEIDFFVKELTNSIKLLK